MSDSDGEYVADDLSDDDIAAHQVSTSHGTRSTIPARGAAGSGIRGGDTSAGTSRKRAAWEDIQRSWDTVVEAEDGSINSAVEAFKDRAKRKRSDCHFLV
jgi:transcription initiation factor TFIIH subunit 2